MIYRGDVLKSTFIMLLITMLLVSITTVYAFYHSPPSEPGDTSNAVIDIQVKTDNPKAKEPIEISFVVKDRDTGEIIIHIDYEIEIVKDGEVVFNRRFHDHEGDLLVKFIYGEGDPSVEGSPSAGGVYTVTGPIFGSEGEYTIKASVVGIEFSPIDPFSNEMTLTVSPSDLNQDQDDMPADGVSPDVDEGGEEGEMMGLSFTYMILIALAAIAIIALLLFKGRG